MEGSRMLAKKEKGVTIGNGWWEAVIIDKIILSED